jgi:hypothetical protein
MSDDIGALEGYLSELSIDTFDPAFSTNVAEVYVASVVKHESNRHFRNMRIPYRVSIGTFGSPFTSTFAYTRDASTILLYAPTSYE